MQELFWMTQWWVWLAPHPTQSPHASSNILQHLEAQIKKSLKEAEKNNDLIYQENVPPPSATPVIKGTQIIREDQIPGLLNPSAYSGVDSGKDLMFAGLEGWGVTRACGAFDFQDR